MASVSLPPSPISGLRTIELTAEWEATLQMFLEANPDYFHAVNGEPVQPGEAHEEIHSELPAGWPFTKQWVIGYLQSDGQLAAMANVVTDLLAKGVWHIGLFIVATARHGSGDARILYQGIEDWAASNGAAWLRLGVVKGNARAERFWEGVGFAEVRARNGIAMGKMTNTVRVMVKSLSQGSAEQYFLLVERDRPEGKNAASPFAQPNACGG